MRGRTEQKIYGKRFQRTSTADTVVAPHGIGCVVERGEERHFIDGVQVTRRVWLAQRHDAMLLEKHQPQCPAARVGS